MPRWACRPRRFGRPASHVPAHSELPIRRLLSHTAGIQREPHGDVWDTLDVPDADRLIAELGRAERVLPPARRFHYSNLGMAILGQLVGRLRGGTWRSSASTSWSIEVDRHNRSADRPEP
jgi:CubicO group peptidase (beta-lactamase class C family)